MKTQHRLQVLGLALWLASASGPLAAEPVDNFVCDDTRITGGADASAEQRRMIGTTPSDVLMYEVSRTEAVLDRCTRPRGSDEKERYLYTWGFEKKINLMLTKDRLSYCTYDRARLLANTIIRLRKTSDDATLNALLDSMARDLHTVPSESYFPLVANRSLEQIEKALLAQREQCGRNARCLDNADGRLAGLMQVRDNAGGFINTATNGPGVYFAADPLSFLGHKKTDQDIGLVCDLGTSDLRITDLALPTTEQALEALQIRIPADSNDLPENTSQALRRSAWAKRSYFEPFHDIRAFEMAAHGRILRFHNQYDIYLDKCAIEYAASCSRLSVKNLNQCSAIEAIAAKIATLPETIDENTTDINMDAINLGYYLIQEGGYANTKALREALERRRELRCGA